MEDGGNPSETEADLSPEKKKEMIKRYFKMYYTKNPRQQILADYDVDETQEVIEKLQKEQMEYIRMPTFKTAATFKSMNTFKSSATFRTMGTYVANRFNKENHSEKKMKLKRAKT